MGGLLSHWILVFSPERIFLVVVAIVCDLAHGFQIGTVRIHYQIKY